MGKAKVSSSLYTLEDLHAVRQWPHILSHIAGYDQHTLLHSEWIRYVWDTEQCRDKLRSIFCHRQAFKTAAITTVGTVWRLLFNPNEQIMIFRKTHAEACETIDAIYKILMLPEIKELFLFAHGEKLGFRKLQLGNAFMDLTCRTKPGIAPSVVGFGLNSQLIGKHCSFAVTDDISTVADRLSRAEREFTMLVWRELVSAIVNKDGFVRYVGTPWSRDGVESIIPEPVKYDVHATGILSNAQLEEIRATTTPILYALNYELRTISDESCLFSDIKFGEWKPLEQESAKAHIDMSYGGADTTCLTVGAKQSDGTLIMSGFCYKGDGPSWLDRVCEILKLYKCKIVAVENNSDKGWTAKELKKRGFIVKEYNETVKKEHKIATELWAAWPFIKFTRESDEEYLLQVKDWMPGAKILDDAPDSAACLCRQFYNKKGSGSERWKWG